MAASESVSFQTLSTPNPEEIMFRVREDSAFLRTNPIPRLGDLYKNCRLNVKARSTSPGDDFGNYVYVDMKSDGANVWFYFGKPKTDAEKLVPFRQFTTSKRQAWPTVLENIEFIEDNYMPNSVANEDGGLTYSPRLYQIIQKLSPAFALCRVMVNQYLAPTKFNIPKHRQMVTSNVQWDLNGARGSLDCLHKDLVFPSRTYTYATLNDGTLSQSSGPYIPERRFPATSFKTWRPFILYDEQEIVNGMYFREKARIFPPSRPKREVIS